MRLHICHKRLLSIVFATAAFFTFQWLWHPLTPERREEGTRHSSGLTLQTCFKAHDKVSFSDIWSLPYCGKNYWLRIWIQKAAVASHLNSECSVVFQSTWSKSFSRYGKFVVRSYDKDEGDNKRVKSSRLRETCISLSMEVQFWPLGTVYVNSNVSLLAFRPFNCISQSLFSKCSWLRCHQVA